MQTTRLLLLTRLQRANFLEEDPREEGLRKRGEPRQIHTLGYRVVMFSYRSKPCEWCGTPTTARCSGCNESHICSKACMKLMWKEHKRTCRKKKTDTVTAIASVTATTTATDALVEQWLV